MNSIQVAQNSPPPSPTIERHLGITLEHVLLIGGIAVFALAFIVGRWSPARLMDNPPGAHVPWFLDIRLPLLVMGLFLAATLSETRIHLHRVPPAVWMPAYFIVSVLLTMVFSGYFVVPTCSNDYCTGKSIDLIYLAFFIFLTLSLSSNPLFERYFYAIIFIIAIILAVLGLKSALATLSAGHQGLTVLEGGRNVYSRILGILAVLSMYYYLNTTNILNKGFLLGVFGLSLLLMILTGSRGGTAASLLALGVAGILFRAPVRGVLSVGFGLAIIGALAVATGMMDTFIHYITDRYINRVFEHLYLSGRDVLIEEAVDIWQHYPLFGAGLGRFSQLNTLGAPYAHNVFMESLSELGMIGLVLLAAPVAFLLEFVRRHWRLVDKRGVAIWVMYFAAAQLSGDLYDSRALVLIPIITACGALSRREHARSAIPSTGGERVSCC